MASGVGVTVDSKKVQRALRTLVKELGHKRVFTELGIATRSEIDLNFQREGNDQGKWKPLAESTIERRRKGPGIGSAKILQDIGRLKQSMTFDPNKSPHYVDVGTNVTYGKFHQEGVKRSALPRGTRRTSRSPRLSTAGGYRIPKRAFLPSAKYGENVIAKRVIDALFAEIKRKMESAGGGNVA